MTERPRLRSDLVLVEQTYRGEQSYIVKDPSTRKYFRFRPVEVAVMQTLDGRRTVAEAAAALLDQGIKVTAATVGRFADKLKTMGLCERTLRESTVLLMERLRAQRRKRLRTGPFQGDLLRLRWSVGDPDHFMDRTIPYLKFFFTREFLITSCVLFAMYFVILALKWPEFVKAMGDVYLLRASLWTYVLLWAVTMVIVVVHEMAHGYTCKHYGGKVHEIGAMLFYFELAFFCNVNDAWTFPERKARLWVTAAGSWIEMVVASIAAIVWWIAAPGTFVSDVALGFFLVGGLAAVLVNLNPLIPLDGYYALSDWLEVPNLRQRAFAHLAWTLRTRWLGLELPMPPADEREQKIFLLYGTLASAYTGLIFVVAAGIAYGWLSRIFGAVGVVALVIFVWLATGQLRRNLWRAAADAWRELRARWSAGGRVHRLRWGLAGILAGMVILGFAPWPITVSGPFVVASARGGVVIAPDSGVVFEVPVREGREVRAGAPLAVIRNLLLERDAVAAARAVDSLGTRVAQARATGQEGEATRISAQARAESARLAGMRERIQALAIRAPGGAIVVSPRPDTLVGRTVSVGDTLLLLDRTRGAEARIALAGAGASLAREGQAVRLIAHADPGSRVEGTVGSVATSASAGGVVESRVQLPDLPSLRPGMTGEARITIRRSTAWGALWWAVRSRIRTDVLL
ncbi:MAG TPA: HlyD family efflux transporter periplasmic adaptor subunit [Gemmatimonadales bacterium]|jgi:putative peptide zinc metalloprotease protein